MTKRAAVTEVQVGNHAVRIEPENELGSGSPKPPHQIEQSVRRQLLAHPEFRFSSLVIRRIKDGVCLEGVVETDDESADVCRLARSVAGVNSVLNHLVVQFLNVFGKFTAEALRK